MPTVVLNAPADIVTIMVDAGLANGNDGRPSKSQARRLIDGGGVRIDAEKVSRTDRVITLEPGASCVLKVGKNFRRLVADNQPAG
jgi:tyrosyl-tRNA synthetase